MTIDSITRIIENHGESWEIGGIKIHPLLFQDDIFAVNKTEHMQRMIKSIEVCQNLKRIQFHEGKTKKSIINGKIDKPLFIIGGKRTKKCASPPSKYAVICPDHEYDIIFAQKVSLTP